MSCHQQNTQTPLVLSQSNTTLLYYNMEAFAVLVLVICSVNVYNGLCYVQYNTETTPISGLRHLPVITTFSVTKPQGTTGCKNSSKYTWQLGNAVHCMQCNATNGHLVNMFSMQMCTRCTIYILQYFRAHTAVELQQAIWTSTHEAKLNVILAHSAAKLITMRTISLRSISKCPRVLFTYKVLF